MLLQRRISRCLIRVVPFLVVFYIVFSTQNGVPPDPPPKNSTRLTGETQEPFSGSLTAIVPVTRSSLPSFKDTLATLTGPSTCVTKVLVTCPEPLLAETRHAIQRAVRVASNDQQPDITLHPSPASSSSVFGTVSTLLETTDRVLVLDEDGFEGLSQRTRQSLLCPAAGNIPVGPRGVVSANHSCAIPSIQPQKAVYLLPPFTIPASLVEPADSWAAVGHVVSRSLGNKLGGLIQSFGDVDSRHCGRQLSSLDQWQTPRPPFAEMYAPSNGELGVFVFLLPSRNIMNLILPMICAMHETGHEVKVMLYSEVRASSAVWGSSTCYLQYESFGERNEEAVMLHRMQDWMEQQDQRADVVFALNELPRLAAWNDGTTLIRIPREDLQFSHWMGTLSLREWLHWNVPRIDVSVITQDRPQSLQRLLASLSRGRFFGDTVNIRLNLEQSSDIETIRIVRDYMWKHGSVFTHRRVVQGGLIPAVVESWYPHSDDEYGLLLEDDVELSPLFYVWVKLAILHYRYGEQRDSSRNLFGVSLYQQKNTELHPEGRKAFNARSLFAEHKIKNPATPYLSQVPCSWGAVYFPEHWREFHNYLANRLSEAKMEIGQNVVPDVRSNNWSRSWKKYMIELVYLRSYVMLYPNYGDFASFSTNHVEVGSHVKERPKEKQDAFRVPLIELDEVWRVLDELPGKSLPPYEALPVVNLTGFLYE
ncbi:Succinate dehydrogenase [ubiquinone] iron-sulfur subunit, mitochondrial [Mycena chlorophos]|uniref:Succinate dehydrogenase [ubiquinone] iron-sulfur subunit, mitochondrial n=1 Tax=Mycena chlorophos TaxID=658473 RepID=A0A8H6T2I5_MYCCL|nr:Succinate dehydrogenase [ubiquinone] iron-sulfur subunit, mitochondrial [Mycena chlorophos]